MTARSPIVPVNRETRAPVTGEARANGTGYGEAPKPGPLGADAYHGIAGQIARRIAPDIEAGPDATLAQILAAFASAVGTQPHFIGDGSRHACTLFVATVSATSSGRPQASCDRVMEVFALADVNWTKRVVAGLPTPEGLIRLIRGPIYRTAKNVRSGESIAARVDGEVHDRCVLIVDSDSAASIAFMARRANTLTAVVHDAWEGAELRMLTKTSPTHSTRAHVSILGHATRADLRRDIDRFGLGDAFANLFLWIYTKPEQRPAFDHKAVELRESAANICDAICFACSVKGIGFAVETHRVWSDIRGPLSEARPGILGAVTARAEAQVLRLATLYALLSKQSEIAPAHLMAALAVWNYSLASARWIWGDALGERLGSERGVEEASACGHIEGLIGPAESCMQAGIVVRR
jgi:hypothetical protein